MTHRTLCTVPAVTALLTARFEVGGAPAIAPADVLPGGTDGFVLAIALGVTGLVVAGLLLLVARRRLTAAKSSEVREPEVELAGAPGSTPGRDRNLPRWLDPSIAAARFRTDTTSAVRVEAIAPPPPARVPVVFSTPAEELAERAQVRYDAVPLLDRPDDVLGQGVWELDSGDQVEIVDRHEIWAKVRMPNGVAGWIPSMTMTALSATTAGAPDGELEAVDAVEPEQPPPAAEPPTLEALLEAIAAQRRGGPEQGNGHRPKAAAASDPTAPTPKRTRARKPAADRPAVKRSRAPKPS